MMVRCRLLLLLLLLPLDRRHSVALFTLSIRAFRCDESRRVQVCDGRAYCLLPSVSSHTRLTLIAFVIVQKLNVLC